MSDSTPSTDLETRIVDVRDNIRELTEQAAAFSGGADEVRTAAQIAEQEALLAELLKDRGAPSQVRRKGPPGPALQAAGASSPASVAARLCSSVG